MYIKLLNFSSSEHQTLGKNHNIIFQLPYVIWSKFSFKVSVFS